MATTYSRELEQLSHSGLQLADPAMDLRGREVCDRTGAHIGTVADLLVDPEQCHVRMLELQTDGAVLGIGRKSYLVPVQAVTGGDMRRLYLMQDRDDVLACEEYRPTDGDAEEDQYRAAYEAYGVTPYWVANGDRAAAAGRRES